MDFPASLPAFDRCMMESLAALSSSEVARHAADYDHLGLVPPPWGLAPDDNERATEALIDEMSDALRAAPEPVAEPAGGH